MTTLGEVLFRGQEWVLRGILLCQGETPSEEGGGFWGWFSILVENFKAYIRSLDFWGLVRLILIIGLVTLILEVTLKGVGFLVKALALFLGFGILLFVGMPWLHSLFGI